jgi:hypothetical protein
MLVEGAVFKVSAATSNVVVAATGVFSSSVGPVLAASWVLSVTILEGAMCVLKKRFYLEVISVA